MRIPLLCFLFWLVMLPTLFAHDGHDPKEEKKVKTDTVHHSHAAPVSDSVHAGHLPEHKQDPSSEVPPNHAHSSDEFPTLHPLIVHFPIMFLLIAAAIQLVQFFVFKRELSWVVLVLLAAGFATAYIAGRFVHPHTHGLSERAALILKEHDLYADWSVWLGGIALVGKVMSHLVLRRNPWAEAVVALVLIGAAYSVAMAGHHGAQLVHIEGVGPQGRFLETHGH